MKYELLKTDNYLLVVDENLDIAENDWTIKNGVIQEVSYLGQDNGHRIVYHLPLNNSPILEGVPLLPPLEDYVDIDDAEELAQKHYTGDDWSEEQKLVRRLAFKNGYNEAKKKYNYKGNDNVDVIAQDWATSQTTRSTLHWENMVSIYKVGYNKAKETYKFTEYDMVRFVEWLVQQKWDKVMKQGYNDDGTLICKSTSELLDLFYSQPKTPTHFEFEMESISKIEGFLWVTKSVPKTITNAQGQEVACGKYIY